MPCIRPCFFQSFSLSVYCSIFLSFFLFLFLPFFKFFLSCFLSLFFLSFCQYLFLSKKEMNIKSPLILKLGLCQGSEAGPMGPRCNSLSIARSRMLEEWLNDFRPRGHDFNHLEPFWFLLGCFRGLQWAQRAPDICFMGVLGGWDKLMSMSWFGNEFWPAQPNFDHLKSFYG